MPIQLKTQNITNMYTPIELVSTSISVYGGGGGGVTDHGLLQGLLHNDHPQYMQTANSTVSNSLSLGTGATISFNFTTNNSSFVYNTERSSFYEHANHTLANSTHIHGAISIASTDGTEVTYSSASSGLTLSIPAYQTLLASASHSHSDPVTTATNGTDITFLSAWDGLTMAVPAFITTYVNALALQGSGAESRNTGTIQFANSHGVTFGLSDNGVMTASIPAVGGAQTGISGIADSATTFIEGTVHYVNSNGIAFGLATSNNSHATLTAFYTVPGATVFSDSNNIEFGLVGSTITALANFALQTFSNQTSNYLLSGFSSTSVHTDGIPYGLSITAQPGNLLSLSSNSTSSGATGYALISSGTAILMGSDNITLIQDGNRIAIKGAAQGGVQTGISGIVVSNTTYSNGTVIFSNAANSDYLTLASYTDVGGQYVRISVKDYLTTAAQVSHTHGGTSLVSSATSNATENRMRFVSASDGLTWIQPAFLTTAALSANTSNYAGVNFGTAATAGSILTATLNTGGLTIRVPAFLTTAAVPTHSHGNPTLTLSNLSGATASNSGGLTISLTGYPATSFVNMSDTGNIYFENGSGVSFGSTYSSLSTTITGSIDSGNIYFVNPNGTSGSNMTFGSSTNGNSTSIFVTAMGGGAVSASNGSYTFNTLSLGSARVTFYTNASGVQGSYTVPPSGTLSLVNANGVSFISASSGSTTSISASVETAYVPLANSTRFGQVWQISSNTSGTSSSSFGSVIKFVAGSNITLSGGSDGITMHGASGGTGGAGALSFSAGSSSGTLGSLVFSNGSGVSFGLAGSTLTASVSQTTPTQFVGLATTEVTGASATINSSQFKMNIPQGSVYYVDGGGVTFGAASSGLSTTITASVNTVGGGGGDWATSAITGSGISVITGAATHTLQYGPFVTTVPPSGTLSLINANGVSFISASGGSTTSISASVETAYVPLANSTKFASVVSLSNFVHPDYGFNTIGAIGQSSLSIKHMYVPFQVTGSAMKIGGSLSAQTSNSAMSATGVFSLYLGIYTLNGSTLSLASSGSANNSFVWSHSDSSTGNTSVDGMRQLTAPININMAPGEYWVAALIRSATTNASADLTLYGRGQNEAGDEAFINPTFAPLGSGTTASSMVIPFQGIFTAQTAALPASIGKAAVNWSSSNNVAKANFYNAIYASTY
jgi:hypothetical protein